MKIVPILLYLLIYLQIICCYAQQKNENDLRAMNLKGNVRSTKEIEYKVKEEIFLTFGDIQPSVIEGSENYTFDSIGNQTECSRYFQNGSLIYKYTYKYDSIEHLIERKSFDKKENLLIKITYKYDSSEYLIESKSFDKKENLLMRIAFNYDSVNTIMEDYLNPDGSLKERWVHVQDGIGNTVDEKQYSSEGKLVYRFTSTYDVFGNLTEGKSYKKNGKMLYKYTYKCDSNNNLIEQNEFLPNGSFVLKNSYTYFFDKKGNWIKRITYVNDVPKIITERNIEYF